MPLFAKAAEMAGAKGIRANSVRDILQIKEISNLTIIGFIKHDYEGTGVYITPSLKEIDALVEVGCEIIATYFTIGKRVDNVIRERLFEEARKKYPHQLFMADCATLEDAILADQMGFDFIGTTMNGYSVDTEPSEGPNFKLVRDIIKVCNAPVIAEGRIHHPEHAKKMLDEQALCVVVGGAITRPLEIATRFVNAINN